MIDLHEAGILVCLRKKHPDSKFHEANMGPTWVLSDPDGPHVVPMNLAIRASVFSKKPFVTLNQLLWTSRTCGQCSLWQWSWGCFKNTYELLNLRALKISILYKKNFFQYMGKIFCVEFQRVPLKFHTKYFTQTLTDVDFIHRWKFKSS